MFKVTIEVGDPAGERFEPVDAVVDTGATYTVLPRGVLRTLEVEESEQASFELADGSLKQYSIGQTQVKVDGREVTTIVVFGDEALVGAYTLEGLRLAVDPARQRLISVPGRLM